jgi:chloramphenicol-sensitive protein RarD
LTARTGGGSMGKQAGDCKPRRQPPLPAWHGRAYAQSMSGPDASHGRALAAALGAYTLWGLLPAFLKLFAHLPPLEVTAQRIVWTIPCALLAVRLFGGWGTLKVSRAVLGRLLVSAALIGGNWLLYVWAVGDNRIIEASLGYFINPLINVALGMALFGERLSRLQLAALGLAAAGVANQTFAVGVFPWVSLALAGSFAAYGLVRKTTPVPAPAGLAWEAVLLVGPALGALVWLAGQGQPAMGGGGASGWLLLLTGPATAIPLILFATGARGLPMSTLGLLQYVAPTLQFTTGLVFGEPFTPAHAVTFALIWTGLALYSLATWREAHQAQKKSPGPQEVRG